MPAERQARFLQMLPQVERQLRYAFRRLDPESRAEALQDGVVNCYCAYARLVQQGRGERAFATALVHFAIRQIRAGRKCGTRSNCRDPLSSYARRKLGHRVERLDRFCRETREWLEPLVADRRASIPDQVALRLDVPSWLATLQRRLQRITKDLALGCSTSEVAQKHRLTAGRISQIRRELCESWHRFQGSIPAMEDLQPERYQPCGVRLLNSVN
jgi:hypothetical protein